MAGLHPLSDITVVEWCELAAGPFAGKWLGEAGADVFKVEPPSGDIARRQGPFPDDVPHPERSGLYLSLNTNKRGVTLDPLTSDGRVILRQLIERADVFLVDRLPPLMEELELDYGSLRAAYPGLVVVSVTPFGAEGPYRDLKAYPLNVAHASGATYHQLSGYRAVREVPDGGPVKAASYAIDCDIGLHAAVATLAALFARRTTGAGQLVDISEQWAAASSQRPEVSSMVVEGYPATRVNDSYSLGGVEPCRDGYVAWVVAGLEAWKIVAARMGDPPWTQQPWFEELGDAPHMMEGGVPTLKHEWWEHIDEFNDGLADWCMQHDGAEIEEMGAQVRAIVAYHRSVEDLLSSEHLRARGLFREPSHPVAGKLPAVTFPFRASAAPEPPLRPAPLLGEHNVEVFCDLLGYERGDLVLLRAAGVI